MSSHIDRLKDYARRLKQHLFVLYLSYKDQRTPWYAKVLAVCVVAYAFSPIDLIPDFIPVLGYLDDLVIVPLGISLALRLIPQEVLAENEARASVIKKDEKPKNWFVGALFILIWVLVGAWIFRMLLDMN